MKLRKRTKAEIAEDRAFLAQMNETSTARAALPRKRRRSWTLSVTGKRPERVTPPAAASYTPQR